MKRGISAISIVLLSIFCLMSCKEDTVNSLTTMEAEIGESFTITGPTEVKFTTLESTNLTIELRKFSDHLVKGLVSPRTYVEVAIIMDETTIYQVETGYTDTCSGTLCNAVSFQVNDQPLLLQFEDVSLE